MDDLDRFVALERRLLDRLSTRIERFEHGVAYFDEDYRERFISNFLFVDPRAQDIAAQALVDVADLILGGGGCPHRLVVVPNDRDGERVAPGLIEHGYIAERSLQMVHRRVPDRPAELTAEECSFRESRPLTEEIYRREEQLPASTIQRFANQHEKWERVIGARRFVVRIDGVLAGQCELYVDGSDAQVEFVDTLEEFRGRGVARAVVLSAIRAAVDEGAQSVFILGDDDDWPKELYRRLGFDPFARRWDFTRKPSAP